MVKKTAKKKLRARTVKAFTLLVLAFLISSVSTHFVFADGPHSKYPRYIDEILTDLEEAFRSRSESEGKISKIKTFRAGLRLPENAAAEAKAGMALNAAEETLKKIDEKIARLEEALLNANEAMLKSMGSLAERLNWSPDEQARLRKALNEFDLDGDPSTTTAKIRQTWLDISARGAERDLREEALRGDGPGFPAISAGEQRDYNDCAVFALANAAGVPYGVAAGRAASLIIQGEWRSPDARKNPQAVIEKKGLNGAELIMLAESFGQAEVVRSPDFASVLRGGRTVMVNVMPRNGNMNGGHEVVLTKTFRLGGEVWYEMVDSNQGPQERLYLKAGELDAILRENGVAFRPDQGRTPGLLR